MLITAQNRYYIFISLIALLIIPTCLTAQSKKCPPVIRFSFDADGNPLNSGDLLFEKYAGYGMHITTDSPTQRPPMVFNSSMPSGGDADLGTPNITFGGTGVGAGGEAGSIGENSIPLGNSMIISEDADSSDPDDNASGGTIFFTFDNNVDISYVQIIDVDYGETRGRIRLYAASGNLIKEQDIIAYGDNSFQNIILDTDQVRRMEIYLASSGSIQSLYFCESIPPNSTVGDLVWYDYDEDGVQDINEPGIPGVTLELLGDGGELLAKDITDANGNYLFPNLLPGDYEIQVVTSTLPSGLQQTYDLDNSLNDHSGIFTLDPDETQLDVDFGYDDPTYTPPCIIEVINVEPDVCIGNTFNLEVTVSYENVIGNTINISGQTFSLASSSATEIFTLTGLSCANNNSNRTVNVSFPSDNRCSDSDTYKPAKFCDISIISVSPSDCSLDVYSVEVQISYENAPSKININDCIFLLSGSSGSETFLLNNLPCAQGSSLAIVAQFVADAGCTDTESINPPCPKPQICVKGSE